MKKPRVKKPFLEQLAKMPNIATACEKLGISRQTVYRWQKEDPDFAKQVEGAQRQGEDFVNDMVENQLMVKLKNGEWNAIKYYLDRRHPKYADKNVAISSPQESATDPIKLAEANIRSLLEKGDKDITKWYLERTSYRYSKESVSEKRQEVLAQRKREEDRQKWNQPIILKPGTEKYLKNIIAEREKEKQTYEEKQLEQDQ